MSMNRSKPKGKILTMEINRALAVGLSCADVSPSGPSIRFDFGSTESASAWPVLPSIGIITSESMIGSKSKYEAKCLDHWPLVRFCFYFFGA